MISRGGRARPRTQGPERGDRGFRRVLGLVVLAGTMASSCPEDPVTPQPASVVFELDAPLCSSSLPVQFSIDGTMVGTDTFRVNLAPEHTVSAAFSTPAGSHVLGARVIGGYVWADTTVSLSAGAAFTRMLPFYCS